MIHQTQITFYDEEGNEIELTISWRGVEDKTDPDNLDASDFSIENIETDANGTDIIEQNIKEIERGE